MKKNILFSLFLVFLFQGCKKTSSTPENYFIRFNIGNTSYLITDTLNVLYAQNLGSYSSRPTLGGDAKLMFAINALIGNNSTKDSAEKGYYTLVTMDCLAGFNVTYDSSILGTYRNDTSLSAKKRSGGGGWINIYNKNDNNRGEWLTDFNGILPFDVNINESNSLYIAGSFQGVLSKSANYVPGDSTITVTSGVFKVPYQ